MSNHCTHAVGSIGWTEHTGGVLTLREGLSLAGPLIRDEVRITAGLLAIALHRHSGRRNDVDPARLTPPDSTIARDAEAAAQDILSPALLNHSRRAYAWGAALAALHRITFDRELLYIAAMFHDTGLPSPVPHVDFTVRSAELARAFTDRHGVPVNRRELVAIFFVHGGGFLKGINRFVPVLVFSGLSAFAGQPVRFGIFFGLCLAYL